jgi:serine/threonine-protein kinase
MGPQPGQMKAVPDLSNLTSDMAIRKIQDAGLTAGSPQQEYSNTVPSGYVTRQSPAANSQQAAKTTVNFWISEGPQPSSAPITTMVPNLVGMSLSDAETVLQNNQLKVGKITYGTNNQFSSGIVFSQGINSGDTVNVGSTIDIWISTGSSSTSSVSSTSSTSSASSGTSSSTSSSSSS